MKTNYLIIWKRETYFGTSRTPLTISVNEFNDAQEIIDMIITELAETNYIKEYEIKIKGIYKL